MAKKEPEASDEIEMSLEEYVAEVVMLLNRALVAHGKSYIEMLVRANEQRKADNVEFERVVDRSGAKAEAARMLSDVVKAHYRSTPL